MINYEYHLAKLSYYNIEKKFVFSCKELDKDNSGESNFMDNKRLNKGNTALKLHS